MDERRGSRAGDYTRGWEHFKHNLAMFRASLMTHLVVSALIGIVVGGIWFYSNQPETSKGYFVQYLRANVNTWLSEKGTAEYDFGDGPKKVASGVAKQYLMERHFQGRTLGFLIKQLLFRVTISLFLVAVLFLVLVTSFGEKLKRTKHRRGAKLFKLGEYMESKDKGRAVLVYLASVVLGVVVFMLILGGNGRRFFSDYAWSAIYLSSNTLASIASPSDGTEIAWYSEPEPGFRDTKEVYGWIRERVFGGYSATIVFLGLLGILAVMVTGGYIANRRIFKKEIVRDLRRISVTGLQLRPREELYSFVFFGSPGSGKSTTIFEVLDQVRARGERAFVYDPKGEFIEKYYREEKDIILNPLDRRYRPWTIWEDVEEDAHYTQMARSLFPAVDNESSRFWSDCASSLFEEILRKLAEKGKTTNEEMWGLVSRGTVERLAQLVSGTPAESVIDPKAESQSAGVLATMKSRLTSWRFLPDAKKGQKPFSIRKYVRDDRLDTWIFLSLRQEQKDALRPLVSLFFEIAISTLLTLPVDINRRLWFFIDELPSLQKMPSLRDLMERGRGHGACTVLGIQSIPQMRMIYGRDGAEAILSMPQTWLVLKSVEPDTASWLSRALGEKEVDEMRESLSRGLNTMRDGVSISENARKVPLVLPTDIMGLEGPSQEGPGCGYLKSGRLPNKVFYVEFDYKSREDIAAGYEPRKG